MLLWGEKDQLDKLTTPSKLVELLFCKSQYKKTTIIIKKKWLGLGLTRPPVATPLHRPPFGVTAAGGQRVVCALALNLCVLARNRPCVCVGAEGRAALKEELIRTSSIKAEPIGRLFGHNYRRKTMCLLLHS